MLPRGDGQPAFVSVGDKGIGERRAAAGEIHFEFIAETAGHIALHPDARAT